MKKIIIIFFFPISLLAQKVPRETNDTLTVDLVNFPIYSVKIDNSSSSDPAKVFIVNIRDFDSIKCLIPECYYSRKQEYNEYYVLGFQNIPHIDTVNVVSEFLNKVDNIRTIRNRSTFLRNYSFDNSSGKITYQTTYKELSQVSNLFWLNSVADLRKNMRCKHRGKKCL